MAQRQSQSSPEPADERQLFLKRGNESVLTYRLKWAAWEWLYRVAGCRTIGFEVRLEGPFGRIADVVGMGPRNRVYLIEVKSSRSDKSRDDRTQTDLRRLAQHLPVVEESVRFSAGVLEAAAAYAQADAGEAWRGEEAFAQALDDHSRAVTRRRRIKGQIATFSTKFHDPSYLRVAHCHYIMAPDGLIRRSELPPMWGLINDQLGTVVEAPAKQVPHATAHVLRAIGKANTRDLMATYGVDRTAGRFRFPEWGRP